MRAWLFATVAGCSFTSGAAPVSSDGAMSDGIFDRGDGASDGPADGTRALDAFAGADIRINLGGAQYTGSADNPGVWAADIEPGLCNGSVYPAPAGTISINGTTDFALFDKYIYAASLVCTIANVPAGTYDVRLLISEVYRGNAPCVGGAGIRLLDIVMEGVTVATAFDEMAASGGGCSCVTNTANGGGHAFTQVYSGIAVTDGALDLSLTPATGSTALNGVLSAIELVQTGP